MFKGKVNKQDVNKKIREFKATAVALNEGKIYLEKETYELKELSKLKRMWRKRSYSQRKLLTNVKTREDIRI